MVSNEKKYIDAAQNALIDNPIPYEQAKAFVENGKFSLEIGREFIFTLLLNNVSGLLDLLLTRHWMLIETTEAFITSDLPLKFLNNEICVFPLSPQFALIGASSALPAFKQVDAQVTEVINSLIAGNTNKFYSQKEIYILATISRLSALKMRNWIENL